MPQTSRYSNDDVEKMMNEILLVLEKNNTNQDLSLMVLGNVLSHVFNHQVPAYNRKALVDKFTGILQKTVAE